MNYEFTYQPNSAQRIRASYVRDSYGITFLPLQSNALLFPFPFSPPPLTFLLPLPLPLTLTLDLTITLTLLLPLRLITLTLFLVASNIIRLMDPENNVQVHNLHVKVFFNGVPWGLYNLHERPDQVPCHPLNSPPTLILTLNTPNPNSTLRLPCKPQP